jgi:acetyltransferase-like isoleucine patch superfamily enzyme
MVVGRGSSLIVRVVERVVAAYRALARRHYAAQFLECGEDVVFEPLSSRLHYEHIRVGSRVYIGPGATIGRADIGDDVMMGPNVSIRDGYHRYSEVGKTIREADETGTAGRVIVGDDVWIGEGAVLLRDARIPEGVVIGTKAMVHGPVPPYTVVVGAPARPVKKRFSDDELREHLRLRGRSAEEAEAIVEERRAGMAAAAA